MPRAAARAAIPAAWINGAGADRELRPQLGHRRRGGGGLRVLVVVAVIGRLPFRTVCIVTRLP